MSLKAKAGSGDICLNGAAARKVHVGDKIIVIAYAHLDDVGIGVF